MPSMFDHVYSSPMPIISDHLVHGSPRSIDRWHLFEFDPPSTTFNDATIICHAPNSYRASYSVLFGDQIEDSRCYDLDHYLGEVNHVIQSIRFQFTLYSYSFPWAYSEMEFLCRKVWSFKHIHYSDLNPNELVFLDLLTLAVCIGYSSAYCESRPAVSQTQQIFHLHLTRSS